MATRSVVHVYFDCSNWSRSALLNTVRERLQALYQETWSNELIHTSKLSTYKDIKHVFSPETYVTIPFLNRRQRRTIAMDFLCHPPLQCVDRVHCLWKLNVCRQCDSGEVEDVIHLFRCQKYEQIRHDMHINNNNSITELLCNNSILKNIANYVIQAMTERT